MAIWIRHFTVSLIVTVVIFSTYSKPDYNSCPCTFDSTTLTANCQEKGLERLPNSHCVPDTTRRLDLCRNNITYRPRQFHRLRYLIFLDLTLNVYFTIGNETFFGLTHLQTLILSHIGLHVHETNSSLFTEPSSLRKLSFIKDLDYVRARFFRNLPNLTSLEVGIIKKIENSPFQLLHSLQSLILYGNNMTFHNQTFSGLVNLERLDLRSDFIDLHISGLTKLKVLLLSAAGLKCHSHSFANLPMLTFLSIKATFIYNPLPKDVFRPLIRLETLKIQDVCSEYRRFYTCKDINENLSMLPSLKKLSIDTIVLGFLGKGFLSLTNLEELQFIEKKYTLDTLSNDTFKNLKNSPISTLVLEKVKTNKILPHTFSIFRNLRSLSLRSFRLYNDFYPICHIETGLQNTSVTYLRIDLYTEEEFMGPCILTGLSPRLETLDFSGSSLKQFAFNKVYHLSSLKYLYLNNNMITDLFLYCLEELESLVILDMSHQGHKDIDTSKIDRRQRYNNPAICRKLPATLEIIDISDSGLLCDIQQYSDPDNALKTLKVSDQHITKCSHDIWSYLLNLSKLETLDMSGNRIKSIPINGFANLKNLKKLFLARNALGPVISFEIPSLVLQILNFSDNSIGYFSKTFTGQLDKISKHSDLIVDLSKNQLLCDCDRIDFVTWIQKTKNLYQRGKLSCFSQPNTSVLVRNIAKYHEFLKYSCTVKDFMIGCASLFVGLHLVLCIGYLLWYRRWQLRYLLAVGRKNVHPYHPTEYREIELEYDVYISYERDHDVTDDRTLHELVSLVVYPALQRRGYRVLIREELEPGVGLYNSVSHALRRCKKVVALVTRDYCRDYWNVFEFNMAVLEGIYTKRQVLIPVAFEQIGREDLHDEIYAFLHAGSVAYHTVNVTDEMLIDYLCDRIRDNREFDE